MTQQERSRAPADSSGAAPLLIACPNLTVDRTATLSALRVGAVLRTGPVAVTPGGKGVNVARTAQLLGVRATIVGFTAGRTGHAVAGMLADEGNDLVAVETEGETRTTAVLHSQEGVTVINEPGPVVDDDAWQRYEQSVVAQLPGSSWLVCSGSCPPGAPDDGYGRLVDAAAQRGIPTLVDTSGDQLGAAINAHATVVAPNLAEAEAYLGDLDHEAVDVGDDGLQRAAEAANRLLAAGARAAVVSAGRRGLTAAAAGGTYRIVAPRVEATNPIGAGDTLAGALAVAWSPDRLDHVAPPLDALRRATATAAASVEHPTAGRFDPRRAEQLYAEVRVVGAEEGASA